MKLIKNALMVLVLLLLALGITLWVLQHIIKPNTLKSVLNKQLTSLTGLPSRIEGDIQWQILPHPGIKVTNIIIGDAKKPAYYSVILDSLRFKLQFSPLLKGQLIFNEITVDGFKANIALDNNQGNKDIPPKTRHTGSSPSEPKKSKAHFAIDSLLLANGQLNISNHQQKIVLSDLQLGLKHFNLNEDDVSIQIKTNLSGMMSKTKLRAIISFKGQTRLSNSVLADVTKIVQTLPLEGQLLIQNVTINQLKVNKINANTTLKDGFLTFNPLTLSLYSGASVGNFTYHLTSTDYTINQTATQINADALMSDLTHQSLIKGNLDFMIHATGHFRQDNWLSHLQTKGNVSIKEGVLNFVDVPRATDYLIEKINQFLTQKTFEMKLATFLHGLTSNDKWPGKTRFQLLSVQYSKKQPFNVQNSVLVQATDFQIKGYGNINLNEQSIYDELIIKINRSDKTIQTIQAMFDEGLPFILSGPLTKPILYPDVKKISAVLTKQVLKHTFDKPVNQFKHWIKQHGH